MTGNVPIDCIYAIENLNGLKAIEKIFRCIEVNDDN